MELNHKARDYKMKFKVLIVASNYYKKISDSLISCAKLKLLNNSSVKYKSKNMDFEINVIEVPGAFEILIIVLKILKLSRIYSFRLHYKR